MPSKKFERSSGILLHPTSLPGPYGIGTLGAAADAFTDFLAAAGQKLWQVLPLGPTGYGDSPYQSLSSFAGNPYLIDPDALAAQGLLSEADLAPLRAGDTGMADFGHVYRTRPAMLDAAWRRFSESAPVPAAAHAAAPLTQSGFHAFRAANRAWLDDWALFAAIKETHAQASWDTWPAPLRTRDPGALAAFGRAHADRIARHAWVQYAFDAQWKALKRYANDRGVRIVGDIPIFAAFDSADAWASPGMFQFDANLRPKAVAGVPPDYFTATGQLWGNPLYDWDAMKAQGYAWWIARMRRTLDLVDIVRIDHFRGFEAYWSVPFGSPTAERGAWVPGPGIDLFRAMESALGELPVIAEDLGVMTPGVEQMRDGMGFPGMKILQFAFDGPGETVYHPHAYPRNCVVYTGTHDNDTTRGWYDASPPAARRRALAYTRARPSRFARDMVRCAWASNAVIAVAPLQDFLELGTEARMNHPGTTQGWWRWRHAPGALAPSLARWIRKVTKTYFR